MNLGLGSCTTVVHWFPHHEFPLFPLTYHGSVLTGLGQFMPWGPQQRREKDGLKKHLLCLRGSIQFFQDNSIARGSQTMTLSLCGVLLTSIKPSLITYTSTGREQNAIKCYIWCNTRTIIVFATIQSPGHNPDHGLRFYYLNVMFISGYKINLAFLPFCAGTNFSNFVEQGRQTYMHTYST